MNSSIRLEIEEHLSRYLAGQSSLAEFHNWFIPATWNMDEEPESVQRFAHRMQRLLAEFANRDRSEDDLRSEFWGVLNRTSITVVVGDLPPVLTNVTTSITQKVGTVRAMRSVGTILSMALA